VRGSAHHVREEEAMQGTSRLRSTFVVVALLAPLALWAKAGPVAGTVSGIYRANGKDARLAYLLVVPHEDFDGKKVVELVMTEKDASSDKHPEISALFGKYGSSLIVGVQPDGGVIQCEVGHQALQHAGASSLGHLHAKDFHWENGTVRGKLTTDGKTDLFDESWEADLDFSGKLP
jgi:hypothetical protein